MGRFIGLTCVTLHALRLLLRKLSNIMENGGEVYQMETEHIRRQMVTIYLYQGDYYVGTFKNGLKHGEGK